MLQLRSLLSLRSFEYHRFLVPALQEDAGPSAAADSASTW